ncbi:MAG: DUF92 domain-containing protein [Taibaiella sp.]|jgi:uncharacterized protein (TIGR00297 family)
MPAFLSYLIIALILAVGAFLSVFSKKLTPIAGVCAFWVGVGIYIGAGLGGLTALAAFFMMSTLTTAHKKELKAKLEAKPQHPERRKAGQVFANGGIAALLGIISIALPQHHSIIALMMVSAISAATADTMASELGMVYGRNAFNILSFKREAKGLDGVISIEGTLLGMAGSLIIACIYCAFTRFDLADMMIIVVAGTLGNLIDSVLGALLERKHMMSNNMVNMLNTLGGAITAWGLWKLLG